MTDARVRLFAVLATVAVVAVMLFGARCLSLTDARCSLAGLFGDAPALDVPYATTRPEAVAAMLDLGAVEAGDRVLDLGTGDGRILLAAAARGAGGVGVDIDPALVAAANATAASRGLTDQVSFRVQDLFETPLEGVDVVTMFLLPEVNLKLRPRLLSELAPGARIVSHAFTMGDWRPDGEARAGGARLYLWIVPARIDGAWALAGPDGTSIRVSIEQAYQQFTGRSDAGDTLYGGTARGREIGFTLRRDGRDIAFRGRVEGDAIVLADPAGWRMTR